MLAAPPRDLATRMMTGTSVRRWQGKMHVGRTSVVHRQHQREQWFPHGWVQ
jgi:hypothetical protein